MNGGLLTTLSPVWLHKITFVCCCSVSGWLHAVGVSIYIWHVDIMSYVAIFRPQLIPHAEHNCYSRCGLPLLHNVLLLIEVASIPDCAQ